ncbi:BrnT family toxin [Enterovirga rhinocerotis]|uniref:Uncharacterized protein n=1 Tax=Enterovirga rhinocerotis TaxID=1339210 RepID=A0A4R7BVT8_9HYPH|nr:BrnT family toxin [Enterovirga rhinocerotis]TDR89661.1 hypothetical protein EV668_2496 [Enterovirga rhinocerotis]
MTISYDPAKNERNIRERGLPFDRVADMDWAGAIGGLGRKQDPFLPTRFFSIGRIGRAVYMVVFTLEGDGIRVVSLRRASKKERAQWAASRTPT